MANSDSSPSLVLTGLGSRKERNGKRTTSEKHDFCLSIDEKDVFFSRDWFLMFHDKKNRACGLGGIVYRVFIRVWMLWQLELQFEKKKKEKSAKKERKYGDGGAVHDEMRYD
jgi:hypothetical protein